MARAAVATASIPEAHALLIVWAGTLSGRPARRTTCRAGLGPDPAWRACPISSSSTSSPRMVPRSSAALRCDRAELSGMNAAEGAAVPSDGGARRADHDHVRVRHKPSMIPVTTGGHAVMADVLGLCSSLVPTGPNSCRPGPKSISLDSGFRIVGTGPAVKAPKLLKTNGDNSQHSWAQPVL